MAAKDLVRTPKKKKLLCYVAFGPMPVGYPFWKENQSWGYHSLPSDLKEAISEDVFLELVEQLVADGLIKQKHSDAITKETGEAIICWCPTAKGRRAAQALFGDDLEKVRNVTHSLNSFSKLLAKRFDAPSNAGRETG